uniref:No apical meristem-associated C-terminal domain-containing protein n=1 Tax=Brassica oleracea var. oleracea TaxID=109376 RepID=A0A0D3AS17_BRAOL
EYFNSSHHLVGSLPRHWSQCKQRWGRVNAEVCRFVGCHESALMEQSSGQTENDVMKAAHDIFFNDYNVKFTLEHCWRELRFDQKWRSHSQPKEKSKEGGPQVVADEEEVRPPGHGLEGQGVAGHGLEGCGVFQVTGWNVAGCCRSRVGRT